MNTLGIIFLKKWPDVVQVLMSNVTNDSSPEQKREASLEALGYICQDIDSKVCLHNSAKTELFRCLKLKLTIY